MLEKDGGFFNDVFLPKWPCCRNCLGLILVIRLLMPDQEGRINAPRERVYPVVPSVCFSAPSGLFTLTGVCIYIKYCNQAMEDFRPTVPPEKLATVDVSFGWSFAVAWLSYSLEVATGLLLMLAARISQMKVHYDSGVAML